jgi:hypothetical protein
MNRDGHDNIDFFIGTEVEHSPAYGKKTLFVVGLQPTEKIDAVLADAVSQINTPIDHIYFGANQSFPAADQHNHAVLESWTAMIIGYLNREVWCTLDFDVACAESVLDMCLEEHDRFIPMISVRLPYIQLLNRNYNTTIKLDDKDFQASNPGVWCHSLHKLMDRRVFTDWSQYTKDTVLK